MVFNMKYRVAIVDQDTEYLERLMDFWDRHSKGTFGVSEIVVDGFYDENAFLLKSEENYYDVVCVGDMVDFDTAKLPENIKVVYLVSGKEESAENILKKYQKPETLYEQLLNFCENSESRSKKFINEEELNADKPVFTTKLSGSFKYRECELPKNTTIDRVALGMLQSQTVPGAALLDIQENPQSIVLRYDITGKISLREYYNIISQEESDSRDAVGGRDILTIIRSFIDTALGMEDYLMSAGSIVWDIDNLFIDYDSLETAVLYFPVDSEYKGYSALEALMNIRTLVADLNKEEAELSANDYQGEEDLLEETDAFSEQEENWEQDEETFETEDENQAQEEEALEQAEEDDDEYIVTANESDMAEHANEKDNRRHFGKNRKAVKRAVHDTGSSYAAFTHEKDEYEDEEDESELPYSVSQDMEVQPKKGLAALWPWRGKTADKDNKQEPEQKISKHRISEHNISSHEVYYDDEDSGETEIFDELQTQDSYENEEDAYETTVLDNEQYVYYLLRKKNNEKIVINRPIFKLGKEKNYVDYCISDNAAVSRNHAEIIVQDGEYYIRDNDSLNHTYINGTLIPAKENIDLYEEDVIFLANEAFVFKKEKLK